jgi:predicted RNase H-like HicB family nuclease
MDRYTVIYERDESGSWTATVPELKDCQSEGSKIGTARHRIRKRLRLEVTDFEDARLIERIKLPPAAQRLVARCRAARGRAAVEEAKALEATNEAVHTLVRVLRINVRDVGQLLGLSSARVGQILTQTLGG